ncbi:uncharacterized protein I206_105367 [Kwoniella pini CBS 10737]|uniref:GH18 domain-containing protein n=1 Tax=Kwoniella pini CBS 10737 TaxID=1296096 RepID=A0AAJ8L8S0_9TREE
MEQIPVVGPILSAIDGESSAPGEGKRLVGYYVCLFSLLPSQKRPYSPSSCPVYHRHHGSDQTLNHSSLIKTHELTLSPQQGNWQAASYTPEMVPFDQLTHLNYAFAKITESGEVILSVPTTDTEYPFRPQNAFGDVATQQGHNLYGCLGAFFMLKKTNRNLKIMLSIGGVTYSHPFKGMGSALWRNNFVKSAVLLVENLGLDGLDISYEFPSNDHEAASYAKLLKELRNELNNLAERLDQHKGQYLLSVAAPCGPDNMKHLQVKDMDQSLDFWNLMAYDFAGPWSTLTNHQANLYSKDANDLSVDKAVKFYKTNGVHSNKLVIGMPLYGRTFEQTGGLGQVFRGSNTVDYKTLPLHGGQVSKDTHLGASWSYDPHKKQFVSYDTPDIAMEKTEYISKHNLGGAMFWELAGDKSHKALDSIVKIVHDNIGKVEKRENELNYPESGRP